MERPKIKERLSACSNEYIDASREKYERYIDYLEGRLNLYAYGYSCLDCAYLNNSEHEEPCKSCCYSYVSKFEKKKIPVSEYEKGYADAISNLEQVLRGIDFKGKDWEIAWNNLMITVERKKNESNR